MDVVSQLQRQFVDHTTSLYREKGFLDDQFTQLQKLQDDSNPEFVVEVVSLFFEDSQKLLNNLASALQQQIVDYKQVDAHVHQFKGSSSRVHRESKMCVLASETAVRRKILMVHQKGRYRLKWKQTGLVWKLASKKRTVSWCVRFLQLLEHEYTLVKSKLETLFGTSGAKNLGSWWVGSDDGISRTYFISKPVGKKKKREIVNG
ncbi:unnamed protein product [Camellia sinensis]